jgi:hypothetical protein
MGTATTKKRFVMKAGGKKEELVVRIGIVRGFHVYLCVMHTPMYIVFKSLCLRLPFLLCCFHYLGRES